MFSLCLECLCVKYLLKTTNRNSNIDELAREKPWRLLVKYSWPALVAMTLNALYSVVDRLYIGQGCGEAAMAGLTLTFPIMMLFAAFGVFVGAGHSAVLSIKLGEGDRTACEKLLGQLVAFKLAFCFILDPIFIFGLSMGISGAAWATNIAMFASFLCAIWYYLGGKSVVRLRLRRIRFWPGLIAKPCGIGFAPFMQQLLGAFVNVAFPAAFAKWAPDEAAATTQIASLGVFQSVLILTVLPLMGAQQGIQPIIGFNWGARNYRRVRESFLLGFWVTSALCVFACLVQVVPPLPQWLARIFVSSDNPSLLRIAASDLQLANCMLWCIGLNVVATTYFQSIGRPRAAIILSTLRQGLIMLPVIWFLPYIIEDHMFAIWLSLPVSDVLCCLATMAPFFLHLRFLSRVRTRDGR